MTRQGTVLCLDLMQLAGRGKSSPGIFYAKSLLPGEKVARQRRDGCGVTANQIDLKNVLSHLTDGVKISYNRGTKQVQNMT